MTNRDSILEALGHLLLDVMSEHLTEVEAEAVDKRLTEIHKLTKGSGS